MKIAVRKIDELAEKIWLVTCDSSIGRIAGLWMTDDLPQLNQNYYAEVELSLVSKNNLFILEDSEVPSSSQILDESFQKITGHIESIDEDGLVYLRLSDDWLQMMDVESNSLQEGLKIAVCVSIRQTEIWPMGPMS
jgi:hypothetical protein